MKKILLADIGMTGDSHIEVVDLELGEIIAKKTIKPEHMNHYRAVQDIKSMIMEHHVDRVIIDSMQEKDLMATLGAYLDAEEIPMNERGQIKAPKGMFI
jgi:hypothetical protein